MWDRFGYEVAGAESGKGMNRWKQKEDFNGKKERTVEVDEV